SYVIWEVIDDVEEPCDQRTGHLTPCTAVDQHDQVGRNGVVLPALVDAARRLPKGGYHDPVGFRVLLWVVVFLAHHDRTRPCKLLKGLVKTEAAEQVMRQ